MAVNVGSAFVSIMPSMSGFAAKMDKGLVAAGKSGASAFSKAFNAGADPSKTGAAGIFRKAGSAAGGAFGSGVASGISRGRAALAGAVGGVASTLATALVSSVGSLAGEMKEASDSAQKFASTLEFARLDSSTIDALKESTQQYADETVYGLADVRNITAQLASNGVKDYDRLAEAAGNLNAVAGGTADTYKSVGMVLTQTAGQGKLTTENWNQLADAIPGASGRLQEAMLQAGAYTGNFREAMEDGEITAQEFNDALMSLGFEEAAIEAAKSTSTLEGAMGQLEASVVGAGAGVLDSFKPFITGSLVGAADLVTGIGDGVSRFLQACRDNGSAEVLSAIVSDLGDAASGAVGFVGGLAASLLGVEQGADPATAAADTLKAALEAASPIVQGAADGIGWLGDNASQAAPVLATLAGAFVAFKVAKGVSGFVSSFRTAIGGVGSAAAPAASGIGKVGGAAGASAPQILSMSVAVISLGAGVLLASAGVWLLANAATAVSQAGPGAAIALAGMVGAVALLAIGAAAIGPALTAGSVGMVAFGAAVALVGVGVLAASAGIALIAAQLPVLSAYGMSGAAAIAALGASVAVMGAGAAVAGTGAIVLGAGLLVAAAGALALGGAVAVCAVGVAALGAGIMLVAAGAMMLGVGVAMSAAGLQAMAESLPTISESAPGAAAGLGALAASGAASAIGIAAVAPSLLAVAGAAAGAAAGCSGIAAALMLASAASVSLGAGTAAAGAMIAVAMATAAAGARSFSAEASSAFTRFSSSARSNANSATSSIVSACRRMASEVSGMNLELPRIDVGELPHFKVTGRFDAETGEVPVIGVDWYAKGGMFGGPSVIGIGEGRYDEAALPLSPKVLAGIGRGIRDAGGIEGGASVAELVEEVRAMRAEMSNLKVYLDGRTLVGGIASRVDAELGRRAAWAAR